MLKLTQIKLSAGTAQQWEEVFSNYPSSEYTCKTYLKLSTGTVIALTGTAQSDDSFLFATTPTSIAQHGNYNFQVIATKDSIDYLIAQGVIHVLPNLSTASDGRGAWQVIYEALMAEYTDMVENGRVQTSITINGRTTTYDRAQILKEISHAAARAGIGSDGLGNSKRVTKILAKFK